MNNTYIMHANILKGITVTYHDAYGVNGFKKPWQTEKSSTGFIQHLIVSKLAITIIGAESWLYMHAAKSAQLM